MAVKEWSEMSLIERFTDKDPSRPAKTWRSRIYWTWPIHTFTETVSASRPRVEKRTFTTSVGEKPCLHIRTTKFKGKTYQDKPLYNSRMVLWNGWGWGWK